VLAEGSPEMIRAYMLNLGTFTKIWVKSRDSAFSVVFREILRPTSGLRMTEFILVTAMQKGSPNHLITANCEQTSVTSVFKALPGLPCGNLYSITSARKRQYS
jgi:hypothetical protein